MQLYWLKIPNNNESALHNNNNEKFSELVFLILSFACNILKPIYTLLNIKTPKSASQKFGFHNGLNFLCYIQQRIGNEAQNISQIHTYFVGLSVSACGKDKSTLEEVQRKYPSNYGNKSPSALCWEEKKIK